MRSFVERLRSVRHYIFNWKKKYDGLLLMEMRRLKLLEDENVTLRKLVEDISLEREMQQDMILQKI
ncbi:hypothetical protein NCH01_29090 [Neoasaia chiangmaiensis]|uniref:Transposase n=1 Tax=Acetobacter senegalensis TaxID=446692 RepID=A0A0U5F418_9PROT|nr:hypothetical protein NCH01_29090 [Neoasaia chiangmaiensis]CEF42648.1 hypothetical protein predicted by Glimmer/Critica [Acetobacter senegalensis]